MDTPSRSRRRAWHEAALDGGSHASSRTACLAKKRAEVSVEGYGLCAGAPHWQHVAIQVPPACHVATLRTVIRSTAWRAARAHLRRTDLNEEEIAAKQVSGCWGSARNRGRVAGTASAAACIQKLSCSRTRDPTSAQLSLGGFSTASWRSRNTISASAAAALADHLRLLAGLKSSRPGIGCWSSWG